MDSKGTKKFLTSKEAADYLGISEDELQGLIDKNEVPIYKIGGVYIRFKADELELYRRKTGRIFHTSRRGSPFLDRIKDFVYFNDFYILSLVIIAIILYYFFK